MGEGGEQIDVVCGVQWFVSGGVGGQQQRWHAMCGGVPSECAQSVASRAGSQLLWCREVVSG
jgi:hypothetical protein